MGNYIKTIRFITFCGAIHLSAISYGFAMDSQSRSAAIFAELDCIESKFDDGNSAQWTEDCVSFKNSSDYQKEKAIWTKYQDRMAKNAQYDSPQANRLMESDQNKNAPWKTSESSKNRPKVKRLNHKFIHKNIDGNTFPIEINGSLQTGYRRDQLNWNIASEISGSTTPNILSELSWTNIEIYQFKTKGEVLLNDLFVFDGVLSYGEIYDGDNQDSDYSGNDRTLEFSRSNNKADSGNTFDITGAIGVKVPMKKIDILTKIDQVDLTVLGGYSYHEQNLEMTDGSQTIPLTGTFSGLESRYETAWNGP